MRCTVIVLILLTGCGAPAGDGAQADSSTSGEILTWADAPNLTMDQRVQPIRIFELAASTGFHSTPPSVAEYEVLRGMNSRLAGWSLAFPESELPELYENGGVVNVEQFDGVCWVVGGATRCDLVRQDWNYKSAPDVLVEQQFLLNGQVVAATTVTSVNAEQGDPDQGLDEYEGFVHTTGSRYFQSNWDHLVALGPGLHKFDESNADVHWTLVQEHGNLTVIEEVITIPRANGLKHTFFETVVYDNCRVPLLLELRYSNATLEDTKEWHVNKLMERSSCAISEGEIEIPSVTRTIPASPIPPMELQVQSQTLGDLVARMLDEGMARCSESACPWSNIDLGFEDQNWGLPVVSSPEKTLVLQVCDGANSYEYRSPVNDTSRWNVDSTPCTADSLIRGWPPGNDLVAWSEILDEIVGLSWSQGDISYVEGWADGYATVLKFGPDLGPDSGPDLAYRFTHHKGRDRDAPMFAIRAAATYTAQ